MKCRSHGIECDYLLSQPALGKRLVQVQARDGDRLAEDNSLLQSSQLKSTSARPRETNGRKDTDLHALTIISPSPRFLVTSALDISTKINPDILACLHHFEAFTSYTCGSPQGQIIFRSRVMSLAAQSPYLMHAILGVAAAHMAYLLPSEVNAVKHARSKLADAWHWGHALTLFRKELGVEGDTKGAGRSNMDSLLSTIMLVCIHVCIASALAKGP